MNWARTLSNVEWLFIGSFLAFYLFYVIRMIKIGRSLGNPILKMIPKMILRFSIFTLLIISLLGPSFGETTKEIKTIGKDIFICLDLSQSMNATDIQPSRLEKVKFELKNIVEAFHSDKIGLIMFSNEAFMQCPLTYDNNALNLFIQTLHTGLVPNSGTNFAPPLEMALDKFSKDTEQTQRQKSKVIILISDGEDFGDNTQEASEKIEAANIKLFTLGVGTVAGSKIPLNRGFKKNRQGNEVISKLNTQSLQSLAHDTEGLYFEINESKNDVERLINAINKIEGELRDAKKVDAKSNKYYYFLTLALVLIVLDYLFQYKTFSI